MANLKDHKKNKVLWPYWAGSGVTVVMVLLLIIKIQPGQMVKPQISLPAETVIEVPESSAPLESEATTDLEKPESELSKKEIGHVSNKSIAESKAQPAVATDKLSVKEKQAKRKARTAKKEVAQPRTVRQLKSLSFAPVARDKTIASALPGRAKSARAVGGYAMEEDQSIMASMVKVIKIEGQINQVKREQELSRFRRLIEKKALSQSISIMTTYEVTVSKQGDVVTVISLDQTASPKAMDEFIKQQLEQLHFGATNNQMPAKLILEIKIN